MRIISGELKGRRLKAPLDYSVRPTSDKVKEAVFSMIAPYIPESVVVDMFAGTGSLGLEAISRGALRAYFIDRDRSSIALVRENVKTCRVEERAIILAYDYTAALSRISEKADIIFLDPPYDAGIMNSCFEHIRAMGILNEEGIIAAEHSSDDVLPDVLAGFIKIKEKKYGKTGVTVYENQEGTDQ